MLILAFLMICASDAQPKKTEDVAAIKAMCGCYNITFNFAETFSPLKDYDYHENYRAVGLEYVFPVEESEDKIVLQHLLIVNDTTIVKHWRQDWIYENTDLFVFYKENTWNYQSQKLESVKGQWTQKVYQVDDSPRYEGSATWVHVDGKHYWESTTDAPLPRREFSKRDDYNVMKRTNRHEITEKGWVHEQDNAKIIRGEKDEILAWEKGYNTYDLVEESKCQAAKDWWASNRKYWADVRSVWDEVFAGKQTIAIQMKVEDKIMFQRLFALGKEVSLGGYDPEETQKKVREVIRMHLENDQLLVSQ